MENQNLMLSRNRELTGTMVRIRMKIRRKREIAVNTAEMTVRI